MPPERIAAHRHVVFWLIDGFALDYLAHAPALEADLALELEALFPSTTATAITSVLTGLSPAQHGLLGWRTYLPAGNTTLTVLPGRETDAAGRSVELSRQRLGDRIRPRRLADRLARATTFVSPAAIAHSAYNRLMSGTARVLAYEHLEQLPALMRAHIRSTANRPHYTYLYWSFLDHLGHEHGPASAEVRAHLGQIDRVYRMLRETLAGTDTLLLTSTDHGMRPVDQRLDLRTADAARACLRHPLTGEPRAALAHVRPGRHRKFRNALQNRFGSRVEVVPIRDWIDANAFGPGLPHPELTARAGDYLLLPDDDSYLVDPSGDDPGPVFHGAHGGRSPAERRIPLCLWASGAP
ncbi:alkaline phosphatase family protein [Thioalkalivibrio paradoxus]|uniref:Phosphodiesterase n=1 Tax=Thioalkalivibrio paradoxus ARh 1 TaxID=713585 RepID=W0DTF9_9GAMM|nr:hypothetical protein THITH_14845 [Thioalkalivibrio paradoxus ARh 1]